MFRGLSSSNHVDEDLSNSAPSTPKSSKKTKQSNNNSKNPYSSRGLDKFTSVLSDLEARKEKIMAKKGLSGTDGTMVRFMYSNSQDWIPIVVRLREENSPNNNSSNPASPKKAPPAQPMPPKEEAQQEKKVKKRVTWIQGQGGRKTEVWWKLRPSYYMLAVMLLILVCLLVFGRVFAICCTAVWWYLVPNFNDADESGIARKRAGSKSYVRKISDKRVSAVAGVAGGDGGVQGLASPRANVGHSKRG